MTAFKPPIVEASEDFEIVASPPPASPPPASPPPAQEDPPSSTSRPDEHHQANTSAASEPPSPPNNMNTTTTTNAAETETEGQAKAKIKTEEKKSIKSLLSALAADLNNHPFTADDDEPISNHDLLTSILKILKILLLYFFFANPIAFILALAVTVYFPLRGDLVRYLPQAEEVLARLAEWAREFIAVMRLKRMLWLHKRKWQRRHCSRMVSERLNRTSPSEKKLRLKTFVFGALVGAVIAVVVYQVVAAHHPSTYGYQMRRSGGFRAFRTVEQPRWRHRFGG